VFLLFAEERRLLPSDDDLYVTGYSVGHLVDQLEQHASLQGEQTLEYRTAAWHRLLALTRAVYAGVAHEDLRLPAYGGGLFDPDRYPWLEGRAKDAPAAAARPPAVDDRTVLRMLRAVQYVQIGGTSSATFEYYVDDIWLDAAAYAPDGGCAVLTANGNGHYTAWSGTASNAVPPSATGALTDSTSGDTRSVVTSPNIASGATVNAVKSMCYVKASTSNTLANLLRSGTTNSETSGATSLSTSQYTLLEQASLTDPNTSSAWTVSGANAAQPGVINTTAGSGTSYCEALYLMVDILGTTGSGSVLIVPPFVYRRRFEPAYFE